MQQRIILNMQSAQPLAKERRVLTMSSLTKRDVDKCLPDLLSPTPYSSPIPRQILPLGKVLQTRRVIKQLTLPATRLVEQDVITPCHHSLSADFTPIESMALHIDNQNNPHQTTLFTVEAKGGKDQGGEGQRDKIHLKLLTQPFGGRFTEATLMVEFVDPDTNEPVPVISYFPDLDKLDPLHIEYEKTHAIEGAVNAGYAHMGANLKGGVNETMRYTMQESAAIVKGIRPDKNSIRWHVKEGPTRKPHQRGLSEPVCVWASIQMTRDVKARFRLSCNFKTEGILPVMGQKHKLPREGSGAMEILFVGMARPAAPEKLPGRLVVIPPKSSGSSDDSQSASRPGPRTDGPGHAILSHACSESSEHPQALTGSTQRLHRDATVYCCAFMALSTFMYFTHFPLVLFLSRALIFALLVKLVV